MNTLNSIKQNIQYFKKQLKTAKQIKTNDQIANMFLNTSINYYRTEIANLNIELTIEQKRIKK